MPRSDTVPTVAAAAREDHRTRPRRRGQTLTWPS